MKKDNTPKERRRFAGTNLVREVAYMHEDESEAIDRRAKKERASKSEIIRRAVRAYLGIEDYK
jgi:metal-responsive CopG/Arc/MetJ family transcriptional regulator